MTSSTWLYQEICPKNVAKSPWRVSTFLREGRAKCHHDRESCGHHHDWRGCGLSKVWLSWAIHYSQAGAVIGKIKAHSPKIVDLVVGKQGQMRVRWVLRVWRETLIFRQSPPSHNFSAAGWGAPRTTLMLPRLKPTLEFKSCLQAGIMHVFQTSSRC